LESQPEAEIVAPTEGSQAVTAATTEAGVAMEMAITLRALTGSV
jgi:hypothetical protein